MADDPNIPEDLNAAAVLQAGLAGAAESNAKGEAPGTVTIDVGKVEEKAKVDPRDTSPPEGSKRWNEVYGKMKEFERQLEESKGEKKQTEVLITEMRSHNQKLVSSLEDMTDATKNASEEKTKGSEVARVEGTIKELQAKRVEATKALDYDTADDLTDSLGELRVQLKELKTSPAETKQQKGDQGLDPVTQSWIDNNKWFKDDAVMRDAAVTYEEQLSQEFPTEPLSEILKRVKDKVVQKFHLKEDAGNAGKGSSLVEGGNSNGSGAQSKGAVRLSPTEVMLANGLGISLEAYAKQKVLAGGK
jgi:hypothetical protein